jgi:predicted dehydrogenase
MSETTTNTTDADAYTTTADTKAALTAPELPYRPRDPKTYRPAIGLIACGGITAWHLKAYKAAGYNIVALCDLQEEKAKKRQEEFFPDAAITTDYRDILKRDDIEVVDVATHPAERLPLLEAALSAGKHVLSQKPFVTDLDAGERLVALAERNGVKFAVNQNGRWSPHFSYLRQAVRAGHIGEILSVHQGVHWDHSWTKGTPFEKIYDLVFYDFAIHWFDFVSSLLGEQGKKIETVYATRSIATSQPIAPPLLAQTMMTFDGGQASLVFDAYIRHGQQDRTFIGGTDGSLSSIGNDLGTQTVTLHTKDGAASPTLTGKWFPDGFHGTMAELLCAIEEDREPSNSARENLNSLALCFAAIASANDGTAKRVGSVRQLG